jgi:hypothetical protein
MNERSGELAVAIPNVWRPGARLGQRCGMTPEDELDRVVDAVLELAVVLGFVVVTA